ncbi:MAG: Ig-like domain-containing protein [Lewinellaceae bacterium]|nr:Ig-like domain-containing protein [Lewinellaceae bacterium]
MRAEIERTPPEIFGVPQPADGILSLGDEISIQFTEPIRCDILIAADQFNNNNVGLYDTETGDLVDAVFTCQGDKIIIVPNVPNRFLENKVLRVEIDNIKDLASNNFSHAECEFFVDRNPIRWDGGNVK